MNYLGDFRKLCAVLLAVVLLGGCSTRTYVSATGSTPPQYTHVYLTIQQVWLSTSALTQPGDAGWSKFTLSEPVTVDLVNASNGTLARLVGSLRLVPGTYSQIRLIPVDTSIALTDSAKSIGATYNNEVDYVDATSVSHQLPLEILNPDGGIGAQGSLTVSLAGGAIPVASPTSTSTSTSGGLSTGSSGAGLGTNAPPKIVNFAVNFNAATDIALFTYGSQSAAVLNSHAQAFDLAKSGGISGALTLTNLANITNASARLNITATAETLSADLSRHVVVISAPVHSDGTFLIYPLPAIDSTKNPTTYDVVIHGAGIQTIIIKGVQVPRGNSSSSTTSTTSTTSTALTAGTATVSVGTLLPQSTTSYDVNLSSSVSLPAGSIVSLYQTLPSSGEVPYVIEQSVIDPFNTVMQVNLPVSAGLVQTGAYTTATDQAITLTNAAPIEGNGSYTVAASATFFNDGALTATVSAPASGTVSLVTPAALAVSSDASSDSYTATIMQSSAGSYDQGQLIVSRDGTIVATTSLNAALAATSGGSITINGLPGGSSSATLATGLYDVSVRVWNSQDPAGTLQHQYFPAAIDVRTGNASGTQLTIN